MIKKEVEINDLTTIVEYVHGRREYVILSLKITQ